VDQMRKSRGSGAHKFAGWGAVPIAFALLLGGSPSAFAGPLESAESFAVLAGSAVTATGAVDSTVISGDIGVSPGSAITGYENINHSGVLHVTDEVAAQAQSDLTAAWVLLGELPFTEDLTGTDLGTLLTPLNPGVYSFSSAAALTGALILDAGSNPDAVFIFQIGTALDTASSSTVNVINGGANNGVYWVVGSSATLGTDSTFVGNILALESITLQTGASITCGRALARNGAVTMDNASISGNCSDDLDFGSNGFSGGTIPPVPEPASATMVGMGLLSLILFARRARTQVA